MSGPYDQTSISETFTGLCPSCGASLGPGSWKDDPDGGTVRCPQCGAEVFINDSTLEFGTPFDENPNID